jgi:hypothetical protein
MRAPWHTTSSTRKGRTGCLASSTRNVVGETPGPPATNSRPSPSATYPDRTPGPTPTDRSSRGVSDGQVRGSEDRRRRYGRSLVTRREWSGVPSATGPFVQPRRGRSRTPPTLPVGRPPEGGSGVPSTTFRVEEEVPPILPFRAEEEVPPIPPFGSRRRCPRSSPFGSRRCPDPLL